MSRPSLRILINFILFIATICTLLEHAHGAPVVNPVHNYSIVRRAESFGQLSGPTKVHTTHTTQTALGPVTETCDITLTPFTAGDGSDLVREDRKCLIEFDPNGTTASQSSNQTGTSDNGDNGGSTDSGTNTSASTSTDSSGSTTDGSNTSTNAGQDGAIIVTSGTVDASAASSVVGSVSTSTAESPGATIAGTGSTAAAPQSTNSVAQNTDPGSAAGDNTPTSTTDATSSSVSLSSTNTAAAANASSSNFQLPGTKLSVLPIGLGVFAGVSVIALIVVGLVTYERTKYRKAFRQRKLAEQGQAPGMSERPA